MNPMQSKTPEQRRAIAAKGKATRRANREAAEAQRQDAIRYAGGLRQQIEELESRLGALQRIEKMNIASAKLTGNSLLHPDEIVSASLPYAKSTGVYFLIDGEEVVYVGQALNVYSRIGQHVEKRFDRYAFVPCSAPALDRLESLYIHCLRPKLNGDMSNGAKYAPIPLDALIGMTPNTAGKPQDAPARLVGLGGLLGSSPK